MNIDPHLPIDSVAARVVSKCSDQGKDFNPGCFITSMTPLPMVRWFGPLKDDMTGRKVGRFTVIGCSLWYPKNNTANRVRWVVKCKVRSLHDNDHESCKESAS